MYRLFSFFAAFAALAQVPPPPPATPNGTLSVVGTLNGTPSSQFSMNYAVVAASGTVIANGTTVPQSFSNIPSGQYAIYIFSGGLTGTFSFDQDQFFFVLPNQTTTVTAQYVTNQTLTVTATFDGQPYSGAVDFSIAPADVPDFELGVEGFSVPTTFQISNLDVYQALWFSGGPPNSVLGSTNPGFVDFINYPGLNASMVLQFTDQPAFVSAASLPAPVYTNAPASTNITVTDTGYPINGPIIDVEIYNSAGTRVNQTISPSENFQQNLPITFAVSWTPTVADTYTIKVGIFSSNWGTEYNWNNSALVVPVTIATQPFFTTNTTTSPSVPTAGLPVIASVVVTNDGLAANAVIVDVETYNSAGTRVNQQFYSNQNFAQGSTVTYPTSWTPLLIDTYTVEVGVFPANWGPSYTWNSGAAIYTVASATQPLFVTSATTAPTTVNVNQPVTENVTVVNNGLAVSGVIVDVETDNSAGTMVYQYTSSPQTFATGSSTPFTVTWTPATTGTYTVKIGIFNSNWTTEYTWNNGAATFTVGGSTLSASCAVNPASITLGGTGTVTVSAVGGTSPYSYIINGANMGSSNSLNVTPTSPGTYQASFTVNDSSGTPQSASGLCAETVTGTPQPLTGSCLVNGQSNPITLQVGNQATFLANTNGGAAPLNYAWSGVTNWTNSNSAWQMYTTAGSYGGLVVITDSSATKQQITLTCPKVTVAAPPPVSASCNLNPNVITLGSGSTLNAAAIGGQPPYQFMLPGSTSFGSTNSQTEQPTVTGTSTYSITVKDNVGNTNSASCSVQVNTPTPSISSYTTNPSSLTHGSPFSIAVSGTGFVSGASVYFYGPGCTSGCMQPAAGVSVSNLSNISVTNISLAAGSYYFRIMDPGSLWSGNSSNFTVH